MKLLIFSCLIFAFAQENTTEVVEKTPIGTVQIVYGDANLVRKRQNIFIKDLLKDAYGPIAF